jgi:glycerol-3-phosphate O-acyltransferase/dihydroxyacetone phosphate acyltransferase
VLYFLFKPLTNIFYRIFYAYEIKGREKIPTGKPIVFAPNHTNGFIDPIAIAMVLPHKIRFFARGDVFKGRIAKWAFNSMNMSPMYRLQEGYSEVKKNDKTFEECRRLLSENKSLLIFPEAICVQEKRLQPLKKGLARIVFQTEEAFDFKKDVIVIPIGLNYSDAKKFRSRLLVEFGDPISLKDYEAQYNQDKVRAINSFTKFLEQKMSQLIITINNKANDDLVKGIEEVYMNQWQKDNTDLNSVEKKYFVNREIVDVINYNDEKNPELLESLKSKVFPYNNLLKKHNLRDHLLRPEIINKMNIGNFLLEFIVIWLGTPLYLLGLVVNYLPFYITRNFSNNKIKKPEFYASVFANMSMILWLIFYGIQLLVVALVFRNWMLLGMFALTVPLLGYYLLMFYSVKQKIAGRWRLLRLVRKERTSVEQLMNLRADIIEDLRIAKENYTARVK